MLLPGLDEGRFRAIAADPPWEERGAGKIKRGADGQYPLVRTRDLPALMKGARDPDGNALWLPAANAHLYLWVTNTFLPDGLWLMAELGFVYKTNLAWGKLRRPGEELALGDDLLDLEEGDEQLRLRQGIGQYFRGEHELCLFGTRGKGMDPSVYTGRRDLGTLLLAPHVYTAEGKRKHSAKPPTSYERIEARSHGPYLELFARGARPNWTSWGNELAA